MKERKITKNLKETPQSQKRLTKCVSKKTTCHKSKWQQQIYCSSTTTIVDKLNSMKSYGRKEVLWSLNLKDKSEIEEAGFLLEPYLYSVRTKRFPKSTLQNASSLIKKLHYAAVNGKKYISFKPRREEMDIIRKYDIPYRVLKYRIILN